MHFLLIISVLVPAYGMICEDTEYPLDNKVCCKTCQPGYGVVAECTYADGASECDLCVPGRTFSDRISHTKCKPCTVCGANSHARHACNATHDAVCECNTDFFYDKDQNRCRLCEMCKEGQGASRPCKSSHNTKCAECPNGTFSDVMSGTLGCVPCSKCRSHEVMLKACTPSQDTICMGKLDVPAPKTTNGVFAEDTQRSNKGAELIPLYCVIMGLIVVALLAYAIYKHWQLRGKKRRAQYEKEQQHNKSTDSGVYIDMDSKNLNSTKVRDLSQIKKKELEVYLTKDHDGQNWTHLASELGYNSQIEAFKKRGYEENHMPVRYLLLEWGENDDATVGILVKALRTIGRQDVVKIIHGEKDKSDRVDVHTV
ncbi:tumor necrosis factor receptor superfamily member 16-like [Tubulanus polymorphus]|uniref:tumor necrosis factor receptor superfamily member 16-like n=1 Tax=Tubulanus polymorphus TaxID=672921 RepID=UPI003DA5DA0E